MSQPALPDPVESFDRLLALLVELMEAQGGQPRDDERAWLLDVQPLAKKFIYHLHSARQLCDGSTLLVNGAPHDFVSHGSVAVLVRAAIETFVTFGHVFANSDERVSEFRHLVWRACGLNDRQKFMAQNESNRVKLLKEGDEIAAWLKEAEAHPVFKALDKEQRRRILKSREWRAGAGWPVLASGVGIHKLYFAQVYAYICSYSHASYLASMQMGQTDFEQELRFTGSLLQMANIFMAHFAVLYASLFPRAQAALDQSSARELVMWWRITKESHSNIYGPEDGPEENPDAGA